MAFGPNDFDRLRAWAALPDDALVKLIDADSIAVMQRITVLLGADARRNALPFDGADFVATVREMDRLYREGARSLGEAIVEASEWGEKQDAARARAVYERFLAGCRSKFHREIARYELRKLSAASG
ncbi:MAG TPA: hypothetical protein VIF14_09770 [Alphaproteobacteria bacterium]|jgi:hypothetical protein